jgi:hypothetical protein
MITMDSVKKVFAPPFERWRTVQLWSASVASSNAQSGSVTNFIPPSFTRSTSEIDHSVPVIMTALIRTNMMRSMATALETRAPWLQSRCAQKAATAKSTAGGATAEAKYNGLPHCRAPGEFICATSAMNVMTPVRIKFRLPERVT